jgi:hypothetical protein
MSRYKAAAYYTVGTLWCFVALAVLVSVPVATVIGAVVIGGAVLTWMGVL